MERKNSQKRNWIDIIKVIDKFYGYVRLRLFYSLFASFIWLHKTERPPLGAKAVARARAAQRSDAGDRPSSSASQK